MKVSDLEKLTGGLSNPSKMPGWAYGIPAQACLLGAFLRKVKNSVCEWCYAFERNMYNFPAVKAAQARRLESTSKPEWVSWMSELLGKKYARKTGDGRVFRWHDSGDLQSLEHLSKIVQVAKNLPDIRFWLPTRERQQIRDWTAIHGQFPRNLTVRISAQMIGQEALSGPQQWLQSTVGAEGGFQCPARHQGNACGPCRACWDQSIPSVNYPLH